MKRVYGICIIFLILLLSIVFAYRPDWIILSRNEKNLKLIMDTEKKIKDQMTNGYCFAYAGDARNNNEILEKIISKINNDTEILWIVFGGDIVNSSTLKGYSRIMDKTDRLNVPVLLLPGNHEMRGLGKILYRYFYGRTFYNFNFMGDQFVILDNSNEKNLGLVQKSWLKNVLSRPSKNQNKFVLFHVPLYDNRSQMSGDGIADENPKEAVEILAILNGYQVSHVFMSHLHGYYTGEWQGLPYTISAGAGSVLHPEPPQNSFYHYIKVRVNDDGYDIEVVKI